MSCRYPLFLEKSHLPGEAPRKIVRSSEFSCVDQKLPTAGGELCWYCCHPPPAGTDPIPMPIDYDPGSDAFKVTGTFCSFPCVRAYNFARNTYKKDVNAINIALFAFRYFGKVVRIVPAPHRERLRAFGGDMTIERFRLEGGVLPGRRGAGGRGILAEVVDPRSHLVKVTEEFSRTVAKTEPACPKRKASELAAGTAARAATRKKKKDDAALGIKDPTLPVENAVLKLKRTTPPGEPDLLSTLMGLVVIDPACPG